MIFNDHSRLVGEHAFLSASQHAWTNYDEEKLVNRFHTAQAAALGTRLHALAAEHIQLGIRMPRTKATLNAYINDAIGFQLTPEQVLFYSPNAFGTADAISFDEKKKFLRIHDLKTGAGRVSVRQLEIYAALFCLEYGYRPFEIEYELRIYQNDDILVHVPEAEDIAHLMDLIIAFDKILEREKSNV